MNTEGRFTLIMLDAGPPGTDLSMHCAVRHWLVNDVTLETAGAKHVLQQPSVSIDIKL